MLRSEVRPAEYCLVYISYLFILYLPLSISSYPNYISYYKRKYKMWDIFAVNLISSIPFHKRV